MRKILLLMASVVCSLASFAQESDYHSLLKEGKTWNYLFHDVNKWEQYEKTEDRSYIIKGDTIIGGKSYKKMLQVTPEGTNYYCALREENCQVLMYVDDAKQDTLLYDFNLKPEEEYVINDVHLEFVYSEVVDFHNNPLAVYHYKRWLYEPWNSGVFIIVEGVGTRQGWNVFDNFRTLPTNGIYKLEEFLSCYEDGECIFTCEDFQQISTDIKSVNRIYEHNAPIYNLQGLRLNSALRKGIYIQNGKKVVMK